MFAQQITKIRHALDLLPGNIEYATTHALMEAKVQLEKQLRYSDAPEATKRCIENIERELSRRLKVV